MQFLATIAGVTVVFVTVLDFVWTALSMRGVGPLTGPLSDAVWRLLLRLSKGRHRAPFLVPVGPIILVVNLIGWVVLTWLGWALIFLGVPEAVLGADARQPAGLWDRVYFAGMTLSTLGVGDLVAGTPFWRVMSAVSALNGLILITSAITYIVSVLSAVTQKRTLAASISILGESPQDILISYWTGRGFAGMEALLWRFPAGIIGFAQQQLAYPILTYFVSHTGATALSPSLARFDETLTLLLCGVPAELQPPSTSTAPLRKAIALWLDTTVVIDRDLPRDPPPLPDLAALRLAGIPTLDDTVYLQNIRALARRRGMILSMVESSGWRWEDVTVRAFPAFELAEGAPSRHCLG